MCKAPCLDWLSDPESRRKQNKEANGRTTSLLAPLLAQGEKFSFLAFLQDVAITSLEGTCLGAVHVVGGSFSALGQLLFVAAWRKTQVL